MATFVGPFGFEVRHEDGQVGGVEGDGRFGAQHIIGDIDVQQLGISD
jgi:hypothetical protein